MILLVCLGLLLSSSAGARCDREWAAYTSMKQVEGVLIDGDEVWAATTGGVLRYDRIQGRYDRLSRIDGLAGNRILSLAADDDGHLWFGSDGQGLSRYRPATSTFDRTYREFRGLAITSLLSLGRRLFVGTSTGVSLFLTDREEVKETYRLLGNLPKDTAVRSMAILDGTLFVGTTVGIAWARIDHPNLQDPESWRTLNNIGAVGTVIAVDGVLYAGTLRGVLIYDPEEDGFRRDHEETIVSLGARGGQVVAATAEGRLLARTGNGGWARVSAPEIAEIRAISRTDEDVLWLGTGTGLHAIGDESVLPSSEPGSSRFYEIAVTGEEEVWAASVPDDLRTEDDAGIYHLSEGGWSVHERRTVVALETDAEGRLWTGSWGAGAFIREGTGWTRIPTEGTVLRPSATNNPNFIVVSDIHRDPAGHMWLLNTLVGVAVLDGYPPRREYLFDQKELGLLPTFDLYRMDIGPTGLKWIVSRRSGLVLLDDGGTPFEGGDDRMINLSQAGESRLTSDRLFAVLASRDGRVWMAAENGVNVLTPDYDRASGTLDVAAWQVYDTSDGLPSAEISSLEEDEDGNVWVGTSAGLSRIRADGQVDLNFTSGNSCLIGNQVKGLRYDADGGDLWIGTLDGLSRLRLRAVDDGRPEVASVYPNPYVTAGREEVSITGLPLGATLRIYSASGDLVATRRGEAGRGTITWDGLNEAGYLVAAGVYYYVAESESGEPVSGRFALVKGARP